MAWCGPRLRKHKNNTSTIISISIMMNVAQKNLCTIYATSPPNDQLFLEIILSFRAETLRSPHLHPVPGLLLRLMHVAHTAVPSLSLSSFLCRHLQHSLLCHIVLLPQSLVPLFWRPDSLYFCLGSVDLVSLVRFGSQAYNRPE